MAYRAADYERLQQFDFVVGIEIKLSPTNHPVADICDDLKGRYPKDFKWTGWHPHCRCHAVTILKTEQELAEDTRRILAGGEPTQGSVNTVERLPEQFTGWVNGNEYRFVQFEKTPPIFLEDNMGMLSGPFLRAAITKTMTLAKKSSDEVQSLAESVAKKFGAFCTPINLKTRSSIQRKIELERKKNSLFAPNKLKDTVRTTIVAERSDVQEIVNELLYYEDTLRWKPQKTDLGYTGNIINIRTRNGLTAEIQVNTPKMIYAKEKPEDAKRILGEELWNKIRLERGLEGGLGHKFYEAHRLLDPASPEALKIKKASREYYKHFI